MNLVPWLAAGGLLGACEVAGRALNRGWPTATSLLSEARGHLAGRVVLIVCWLWLGWHVFAR